MTKFGSKIAAFALISTATIALSACGSLQTCNDELDQCNRSGPYTEERTAKSSPKAYVQPAPVPEPMPEPAPEPVAEPEPAPEPVIDDTPIMTKAEPQFKQISK